MRRLPLALSLAAGSLLLALLLWRAVDAVQAEERTRQTMIAERVFDELERALQDRLDREEERPFLHYNNRFVVDNDLGLPASKTSPLVGANDSAIVGYFQRAPDGDLTNPYRLPDGTGALDAAILGPMEHTIELALTEVEAAKSPSGEAHATQQAGPPILQALNKGLRTRARAPTVQSANASQLGNFVDPLAKPLDPTRTGVQVEPFEVAASPEWLVFERRVVLDGEVWEQGFVAHRERFLEMIVEEALGELKEASVHWDSRPARFSHRFQEPFQALRARLTLAPLPGLRSTRVIFGLAASLLLVVLASGLLVARWLQQSARLAQQRTDFVAAVTHELRTPLTSIRMYAEMLEHGMAPPDARQSYLATIRTEAERLGTLVEGVLTFAALERDSSVDLGPTAPLGEIVEGVRAVLQPIADEREVHLSIEVEDGTHQAPRQAMSQVVHNLLENAIKFAAPPNEVRILVNGELLEVWNTAPPLHPDLLGRLFDPFVRGGSELTRRTKGTGIGLAVVKGLVERLGGRIRADHDEGGVVFRVRLPKRGLDNRSGVGQDSA